DTGTAQVLVPDYQLSLAIGKEGQNARLAAKLTGCRIDIKSESQAGGAEDPRREARRPSAAPPARAADREAAPAEQTRAEEPAGEPVLAQAAEAPEVEVAAPGNGSVPPDPQAEEPADREASASA